MRLKPLLLFAAAAISSVGLCQIKPRYALIIGNSNYHEQGKLKNPVNDATLMASKLRGCGFRVLIDSNLTRQGLESIINRFYDSIKIRDCEALFYYSGHGIQYQGDNYIIPVNATLGSASDIETECVVLGKILGKMNDSRSSTNIIILDACRNNPFSRSWSRGETDKGLRAVTRAPNESIIFYATAQNEVASDGTGKNSPFTLAFARHIDEPGLTINSLLIKIINEVNGQYVKQRPWGSMSMRKEFYFVPPINTENGSIAQDRQYPVIPNEKKDLADINLVVNAPSMLFIDGESFATVNEGVVQQLMRYPGQHRIRAVSLTDTSIFAESDYTYSLTGPNVTYINLKEKLDQVKAKTENDPNYVAKQKVLRDIQSDMIRMNGGAFLMGNNSGNNDESPQHRVSLPDFSISRFEISQEQWNTIMGSNPSSFGGCNDCPVENVSWNEIHQFINTINTLSGNAYRLPTEAEWEYSARGGNLSNGSEKFSGGTRAEKYAWIFQNAANKTHPRGSLSTNEKGLYDMTGNVSEWCEDWYDGSFYNRAGKTSPAGPANGNEKVIRGGSWNDDEAKCRLSLRQKKPPETKDKTIGFRLALN